MARRTRKPPQHTPPPAFDWKNHPVIVASGSAAATFLLSLAVFTQLVIPTQNAKIEIELLKLKEAKSQVDQKLSHSISGSRRLSQENSVLRGKVKVMENSNATLERKLIEAKAANIFTAGNPYPNGLGLVRIGMAPAEIYKAFAGHKIETDADDPDIITVKLKGEVLDRVTFHLTDKTENAVISHLSFDMPFFDSKYSDDFLHRKLIENFGAPSKDSTPKTFMWSVGSSHSLFAHNKTGYVLMRRGSEPIFWEYR